MSRLQNAVARSRPFFEWVAMHPRSVLAAATLIVFLSTLGLTQLVRDPSLDAFVPKHHASYIASEKAKALFGLSDPIVVGIVWQNPNSVFTPKNLQAIRTIHRQIEALPNVRYDGVTSIASESYVEDDVASVQITPYVDDGNVTSEMAKAARIGWQGMAPHQGTLVAADGRAATILVELEDSRLSDQTYRAVRELLSGHERDDREFHVAGVGAVVGYLGESISTDVRVLVPLIYLVVLATMFVAFRRIAAIIVPLPVIIGAVAGTLGVMASMGIAYFAITSALPVVIVAIAVADTIHILSAYREEDTANGSVAERVVNAMVRVVQPITLTTITTVIGFVAIAVTSIMPPLGYFAWFAALGIVLALVFSVTCVPAMMVLLQLELPTTKTNGTTSLSKLTQSIVERPTLPTAAAALVIVTAVLFAMQVRVDRALVEAFSPQSDIHKADRVLNEKFAGTAFLDVIVEADKADGLLNTKAMQDIVALQAYMESLPHVQKTVAVTDYIGQIHRAIEGVDQAARSIPANGDAIAQYLLLYEASARPNALQHQIDDDYQRALVRGIMNTRYYSEEIDSVVALQEYLDRQFVSGDLTATISGRVNTRHHWMSDLARSHVLGVSLSVLSILLMTAYLFHSFRTALSAVIPVVVSVLCLYAIMMLSGTHLEPATSMYAAISIGVGVDYAIHLVHRLRTELAAGLTLSAAAAMAMQSTGRACMFNAAALGFGFAVLTASDLMTLKYFGALIAAAAFASFLAAIILVPLFFRLVPDLHRKVTVANALTAALGFVLVCTSVTTQSAWAEEQESGAALAAKVSARSEGRVVRKTLIMRLIRPSGSIRERTAVVWRMRDQGTRNVLLVFTAPKSIRESAFLNKERLDEVGEDNRWLFLPATERVRRLPTAQRGDYFLGTDLTYADIQSELKFNPDDYEFESIGEAELDEKTHRVLRGTAKSIEIAKELGHGGFTAWIDERTFMPQRIEFNAPNGDLLKTIVVSEIAEVQGVTFATEIEVRNEKSGHQTVLSYTDITMPEHQDSTIFEPGQLRRGLSKRL